MKNATLDITDQRLDKWLWAARFYKTRSVAADAINGGKVSLNGHRAKPGKTVKSGDVLDISRDPYSYEITVLRLSRHRGPAAHAVTMYEESESSQLQREELAATLRAEATVKHAPLRRPDKRGRRQIRRFIRKDD